MLCQIKISTPKGSLDVIVREGEDLFKLVNSVYREGGFIDPEMREGLHSFFTRKVQYASAILAESREPSASINFKDPSLVQPFYPIPRLSGATVESSLAQEDQF